jgi:hypothetical protein
MGDGSGVIFITILATRVRKPGAWRRYPGARGGEPGGWWLEPAEAETEADGCRMRSGCFATEAKRGPGTRGRGPARGGRCPTSADGLDAGLAVTREHVAELDGTVEQFPLVFVSLAQADVLTIE